MVVVQPERPVATKKNEEASLVANQYTGNTASKDNQVPTKMAALKKFRSIAFQERIMIYLRTQENVTNTTMNEW